MFIPRDQAIGTSAKGHGTKICLQHVFMGLQVFLAEFGKTYIIFIEIRHGTCTQTDNGQKYSHASNFPYIFHIKLQFSEAYPEVNSYPISIILYQ